MTVPTEDEIVRVRVWECHQKGHDFEVLQLVGTDDPQGVVCSRCGRAWHVVPEKD